MPRSPSKTPSERRIRAERAGHRSEALAALFLRAKLYRIRATRFKTPVGEIDLVVQRGNMVAFVEVKSRTRFDEEGLALASVNRTRIARAAQYWLARHPAEAARDYRFDVIFLAPGRWPRHLINAFSLS